MEQSGVDSSMKSEHNNNIFTFFSELWFKPILVVAFFYFLKTDNLNRMKIILARFNTNTQTLTLPL